MPQPPRLTDRVALMRNRQRATGDAMFLCDVVADELHDRLTVVKKSFTEMATVSGMPEYWGQFFPSAKAVLDEETLALEEGAHDLVVHAMGLHWANDPVGQLIQARRALRPDGLFLGAMYGGQTLHELRACLGQAEAELTGGLTPRVAPMAELRDIGGLLQRAGFALPVTDNLVQTVTYQSPLHLMRDLRAMGESNALAGRQRTMSAKSIFARAAQIYSENFMAEGGRIEATFEVIFLTGWSPGPNQPQPLRPGSATARLADALGVSETPLSVDGEPD